MRADDRLPEQPFTLADAAAAGVGRATVYRKAEAGELIKLGPGLFIRTTESDEEGIDHDFVEAVARAPLATICLTSALARHGLVDAIPASTDLALPRGTYRPITGPAVTWHQFDHDTFDLGRTIIALPGTAGIGLYDAPRAIVDVFRLRGSEGYEIGIEALRNWLRRPGAQPAAIMNLAQRLPRAARPIRTALEHLA